MSMERGWAPAFVMVMVSLAFGIGNGLVEKALQNGLDGMVLVAVRQLVAASFLGPIAFFKERKSQRKLTRRVFVYILINALIGGSLAQYLFYIGMQNTSATYACAFLNLLPVLTFLVALTFRVEKVNFRTIIGKAKLVASALCVAGVVVLICYRGAPLTHAEHAQVGGNARSTLAGEGRAGRAGKWIIGSLLLIACCLCWTAWFLLQSKISKEFPSHYSSNALMFLLGFFQAAALTLATQKSFPLSTMKGRIEIITVIYSGVVSSALGFVAMTWCVARRGPVFPSVFTPLVQMFAGIIDFSVMREPLFLGSVLGSILVITGLYILLWAKTKEVESVEVKPVEEPATDLEECTQDHSKTPV